MSSATRSLRTRLPELVLEAVMVVFAVLVALGLQEWRDERQMQEFADRARAAVLAEIGANLEEFRNTGSGLSESVDRLGEVVREDDPSLLVDGISLTLPDISTAAWGAALVSQATPYFDYDWMIRVSRVYEVSDVYSTIADGLIDALSAVIGGRPTIEEINSVYGRLLILVSVHGEVEERLEALLEDQGSEAGSSGLGSAEEQGDSSARGR